MEKILQKILTEITGIKGEITVIKQDLQELKEKYEAMDERQKEMYLILKGGEEDRPFTKKTLDRLEIDVNKLKNHKHNIVLPTDKA